MATKRSSTVLASTCVCALAIFGSSEGALGQRRTASCGRVGKEEYESAELGSTPVRPEVGEKYLTLRAT